MRVSVGEHDLRRQSVRDCFNGRFALSCLLLRGTVGCSVALHGRGLASDASVESLVTESSNKYREDGEELRQLNECGADCIGLRTPKWGATAARGFICVLLFRLPCIASRDFELLAGGLSLFDGDGNYVAQRVAFGCGKGSFQGSFFVTSVFFPRPRHSPQPLDKVRVWTALATFGCCGLRVVRWGLFPSLHCSCSSFSTSSEKCFQVGHLSFVC
jgi:hypothetical protein